MHLSIRKVKPSARLYKRLLRLELYEPGWTARSFFEVGANMDDFCDNDYFKLRGVTKIYLARVGGKTVGWSILFDRRGAVNKSIWAYVKPEFRRRGIGKRLVKRCRKGLDPNKIKVDRTHCYQEDFWDVALNLTKKGAA